MWVALLLLIASADTTDEIEEECFLKSSWDYASALKFTPDSTSLIVAYFTIDHSRGDVSTDGEIAVFSVHPFRRMMSMRPGHGKINDMAVSPDGKTLVCACWDGDVVTYDLTNWTEKKTTRFGSGGTSCVSFSPNGDRLATGSFDGQLTLWNSTTWSRLHDVWDKGGGERIVSLDFSRDGTRLVCARYDGAVTMYTVEPFDVLATVRPKSDEKLSGVEWAAFSPDGERVAIGGRIYTIVHDIATNTSTQQSETSGEVGIYTSTGTLITSNTAGFLLPGFGFEEWQYGVYILDGKRGNQLSFFVTPTRVSGLAISADQNFLAISDYSGHIAVRDLRNGRPLLPYDWWRDDLTPALFSVRGAVMVLLCVMAIALVLVMRAVMLSGVESRFITLYKLWHSPAILAANAFSEPFLMMMLGVVLCMVCVCVSVGIGALVGTVFGVAGTVIGSSVGFVAAIITCESITRNLIDYTFWNEVQEDICTSEPMLRTVENHYVFPLLCILQTATLFGMAGSIVGAMLSGDSIQLLHLAVVSAFAAIVVSQAFQATNSKIERRSIRLALAIANGVLFSLLLLPMKKLLEEQPYIESIVSAVAGVLGGQFGVESLFVAVVAGVTALLSLPKRQ